MRLVALVILSLLQCTATADPEPGSHRKLVNWRWKNLDELPPSHLRRLFYRDEKLWQVCQGYSDCPYQDLNLTCWGYEDGCDNAQLMPKCTQLEEGWGAKDLVAQAQLFWEQGDWGYVKRHASKWRTICESDKHDDRSAELRCSEHAHACTARNVAFDFRHSELADATDSYRDDVLPHKGLFIGKCTLNEPLLEQITDERHGFLHSWSDEMSMFTAVPKDPFTSSYCDVEVDQVAYIVKLDAGSNMYHHFCDFVNFYASQHIFGDFSREVIIVNWDTKKWEYWDPFQRMWNVFSNGHVQPINGWHNKRVCFKEVRFSLPPRMHYGLYYNMPLVPNCYGSSLMKAFNEHVIHRLGVKQSGPLRNKFRVTVLDRKTEYRNILNIFTLVNALRETDIFNVTVATFDDRGIPFEEQPELVYNTDIFVGLHGAGLTHALLLPHWGSLVELYNCGDETCYKDLARLRGVNYFTWDPTKKEMIKPQDEGHHPQLGAHEKFTNYSPDPDEFVKLVKKAGKAVWNHAVYKRAYKRLYGRNPDPPAVWAKMASSKREEL